MDTETKPKPTTYEIRVLRLNEMPAPDAAVDTPEKSLAYWREVIEKMPWFIPDREICAVILLNTRLRPVGCALVSIGSLNESIVHPRDVFRPAIALGNAYAVVLLHNHPSGDPAPSEADTRLTRRICEGAAMLQITLLDHLIVGEGQTFYSFKMAGLI